MTKLNFKFTTWDHQPSSCHWGNGTETPQPYTPRGKLWPLAPACSCCCQTQPAVAHTLVSCSHTLGSAPGEFTRRPSVMWGMMLFYDMAVFLPSFWICRSYWSCFKKFKKTKNFFVYGIGLKRTETLHTHIERDVAFKIFCWYQTKAKAN